MASRKKQNFEKKRKKKQVSSTSTENSNEFTLQNVVELGGDEVGPTYSPVFANVKRSRGCERII